MNYSVIAVDIGNTKSRFWVIRDDVVLQEYIYDTRYIERGTFNFLELEHDIIVSCVAPEVMEYLEGNFDISKKLIYIDNKVPLEFKILIDKPETLGADRICALKAARKYYGNSLIIIDMGTATTFDIINESGDYIGGFIAAGAAGLGDSLYNLTSLLPRVEISKISSIIAKSTVEAIESGIFFGYISMIEGLISRVKALYPNYKVLLTGGWSNVFKDELKHIDYIDTDLLRKGLMEIYKQLKGIT